MYKVCNFIKNFLPQTAKQLKNNSKKIHLYFHLKLAK
jgi:hypothetical protein